MHEAPDRSFVRAAALRRRLLALPSAVIGPRRRNRRRLPRRLRPRAPRHAGRRHGRRVRVAELPKCGDCHARARQRLRRESARARGRHGEKKPDPNDALLDLPRGRHQAHGGGRRRRLIQTLQGSPARRTASPATSRRRDRTTPSRRAFHSNSDGRQLPDLPLDPQGGPEERAPARQGARARSARPATRTRPRRSRTSPMPTGSTAAA